MGAMRDVARRMRGCGDGENFSGGVRRQWGDGRFRWRRERSGRAWGGGGARAVVRVAAVVADWGLVVWVATVMMAPEATARIEPRMPEVELAAHDANAAMLEGLEDACRLSWERVTGPGPTYHAVLRPAPEECVAYRQAVERVRMAAEGRQPRCAPGDPLCSDL